MRFSTKYIFIFSIVLCLICSLGLSVAAVALRDRQEVNKQLDQKKSVLMAARLMDPNESISADEVLKRFENIELRIVDLESGTFADVDPATWTFEDAPKEVPEVNSAQLKEVPTQTQVFFVKENGQTTMLVLPIYGKGLWSTLWGYLALDNDTNTIRGLTYYQHGETPGLGGEVDNPRWKNRWPGRKAYDEDWEPAIRVIKGAAGSPEADPHHVDGLSGATITARGVTHMLEYWLGENGFGPFLRNYREGKLQ